MEGKWATALAIFAFVMATVQRFKNWEPPTYDSMGMTKWGWKCLNHENLVLGKNVDIGAFTLIVAKCGVEIQDEAQLGSHCAVYSWSTVDDKHGKVTIKRNARIGSHTVIMPGVTIGENAIVGACSFVNSDILDNSIAYGVPARAHKGTIGGEYEVD